MTEYEVVVQPRMGKPRVHPYAQDEPLRPGEVLRLEGRFWLVDDVDEDADPPRATAKPARYRLRLLHPDGREEKGVFRRFRPAAPRLGHSFTTLEDGQPVGWAVVQERLAHDDQGEPYLDLVAERDYTEVEELPDHELEHAIAAGAQRLPAEAVRTIADAQAAGLLVELVALDPGEPPDWHEAETFIEVLQLEEVEDDLLEQCGVNPDRDPRETWIETVRSRLRQDLEHFRSDVEGDHHLIEQWEFLDGRIFAATGTFDDESDPDAPFGWLCRLLDAEALGAAGFNRVRKAELQVAEG